MDGQFALPAESHLNIRVRGRIDAPRQFEMSIMYFPSALAQDPPGTKTDRTLNDVGLSAVSVVAITPKKQGFWSIGESLQKARESHHAMFIKYGRWSGFPCNVVGWW